jgi:hypothetical protein
MHASPLHDNPNRIMPTVPGISGGSLRPSIGCDNWRTSNARPIKPRLKQHARPTSGLVDLAKVPSYHSTGRETVIIAPDRPKLSARKRRAIAKRDHALRLAL